LWRYAGSTDKQRSDEAPTARTARRARADLEREPGQELHVARSARDDRTDGGTAKAVPALSAAPEARGRAASRAVFLPGGSVRHHRERSATLARYESRPRHVVDAHYLGDYKVWLEFNDGRKGVVDLADELVGESMEPLRDRTVFSQFYIDYGLASIAWQDGQDFAPEFLYERLKAMN